jgi:hypothetical protein
MREKEIAIDREREKERGASQWKREMDGGRDRRLRHGRGRSAS